MNWNLSIGYQSKMNKFCYKLVVSALAVLLTAKVVAQEMPKWTKDIVPLDADFLLYIAQMEKIDKQWLDPISVNTLTDKSETELINTVNETANKPKVSDNSQAAPSKKIAPINDKGAL